MVADDAHRDDASGPRCAGDGCGAGEGLHRSRVGETDAVVAKLSEDAGAEYRAETGQAGDQLAVGVLLEPLSHGGLQAVGVVGCGVVSARKWARAC